MSVKVLKSRQFARWAKSEQLTDHALRLAAREIERGLMDASLGGSLLKKRISKATRERAEDCERSSLIAKSTGWFFSLDLRSATGPTLTRQRGKRCSN